MSMTDPIADMLIRLRSANSVSHESVSMPYPKLKTHIVEILEHEGCIAGFGVEEAKMGKTLILSLKYESSRKRALTGLRCVSKPGLRVYAKSTNLPKILGGLDIAILSASSDLLTDREAKDKGVGEEVFAYV